MRTEKKIEAFANLGAYLREAKQDREFLASAGEAQARNPFFDTESIVCAVEVWGENLRQETLQAWIEPYRAHFPLGKTVAVVMAGNIPIVGYHDYLCALISGCRLYAKLSAKDAVLLPFLHRKLRELAPSGSGWTLEEKDSVSFYSEEFPSDFDSLIATGGDNAFLHFDSRYAAYPRLLRKNRSSCAVLDGSEPPAALAALAEDIFLYYGLGCRSVSKLYLPCGYNFEGLLQVLRLRGSAALKNPYYRDNYQYQKALAAVSRTDCIDSGSLLLKPSVEPVSPLATVHYQFYRDLSEVEADLEARREKIQCAVGVRQRLAFGQAQSPRLDDYADGIDTLRFLSGLTPTNRF